jgi:hypothetical protein
MRSLFSAAILLFSVPAMATPVTFDFTGTMTHYFTAADTSIWTPAIDSLSDKSVSGSITFDLDLALPTTSAEAPDEWAYQVFRQQDMPAGTWIQASLNWAGGTFAPAPFGPNTGADLIFTDNYADPMGVDGVTLTDAFARSLDGVQYTQSLSVSFGGPLFGNGPILTPTLVDLKNLDLLASPVMSGSFINYSYRANPDDPENGLVSGYDGWFQISSISVRPTSVPEPGSLALMSLGLISLALSRRSARDRAGRLRSGA